MPANARTILFAGGGTGGHIFPNVAVVEKLRERGVDVEPHFLVSERQIDAQIMDRLRAELPGIAYSALPARPLTLHPLRLPGVALAYQRSVRLVAGTIDVLQPDAVVGTGGFVSGPALAAAAQRGVRSALVNLDAVPGKANRMMAWRASVVFSAYPTPLLPAAQRIGVPVRASVLRQVEPGEARQQLALQPNLPTLLVTAGSQGARSINAMMIALCADAQARAALDGWQVLHQAGAHDGEALRDAYADAGVPARILPFCDDMGLGWSAADAAISRSGAGSAAEVWARAVPTIFLPYPYHKDQHQRLNAQPLVEAGGAVMLTDHVDAAANVAAIREPLCELLGDPAPRGAMRKALRATAPPDGAQAICDWLVG